MEILKRVELFHHILHDYTRVRISSFPLIVYTAGINIHNHNFSPTGKKPFQPESKIIGERALKPIDDCQRSLESHPNCVENETIDDIPDLIFHLPDHFSGRPKKKKRQTAGNFSASDLFRDSTIVLVLSQQLCYVLMQIQVCRYGILSNICTTSRLPRRAGGTFLYHLAHFSRLASVYFYHHPTERPFPLSLLCLLLADRLLLFRMYAALKALLECLL